jgi:hypothetical protein
MGANAGEDILKRGFPQARLLVMFYNLRGEIWGVEPLPCPQVVTRRTRTIIPKKIDVSRCSKRLEYLQEILSFESLATLESIQGG